MNDRFMFCLPVLLVGLLVGCATPGYKCDKPAACNPVRHNYNAAVSDNAWAGWQAGHPKVTQAQAKAMAEGKKKGQPVPPVSPPGTVARGTPFVSGQDAAPGPAYTPPRPWRVWLAPYSRNDGTLASGSYLWFTTPGHWNYLGRQWQAPPFASIPKQTQTFGSADTGANGPVPPSELGFTPGQARAPKGVLDNITQPGMAKSQ